MFYAFPQELVNKIVERTGGRPITVAVPELCDGEVEIDAEGRVFLVAAFPNGDGSTHERRIFHMQVTEKGEVFMDRDGSGNPVVVDRVHPFSVAAREERGARREGGISRHATASLCAQEK